jgi:hypothetical protein
LYSSGNVGWVDEVDKVDGVKRNGGKHNLHLCDAEGKKNLPQNSILSHKKGCAKHGAGFYKTVNSGQWSMLKRIVRNCYRIQAIIPGSLIC